MPETKVIRERLQTMSIEPTREAIDILGDMLILSLRVIDDLELRVKELEAKQGA